MIDPDLSLQKPLEDYIEYIEKLNVRSIPLLGLVADPALSYQDPYHNVRGIGDVEKLFKHRFGLYPDGRYKVSDFMWGRRASTAYMFWTFCYKPEKKKVIGKSTIQGFIIEGMSELMFSPEGKVFSHADFWGGHDDFNVKAYRKSLD